MHANIFKRKSTRNLLCEKFKAHGGGGGGGGGGAITKHMCSACMQNKLIRYCIIKGKAPLRQKCGGNFLRGPVHPTHRRENSDCHGNYLSWIGSIHVLIVDPGK